jgi:hypothetical protein
VTAMGHYFKNLNFWLGVALSAVVVAMALVSLFWTPYSPTAMDARHRMEAPSPNHPWERTSMAATCSPVLWSGR